MSKVEERSEQIQAVADDLVDDIVAKGEEFELRRHFGRPLPSTLVAEILGIPVSDRPFFMDLTERAEAAASEPEVTEESLLIRREFDEYISAQFEERERHPTDDLLSAILHAEVGDQRFTRLEAVALVRLLLGAGNGTTSIAISNTVWLLESNPTEKAKLLADMERVAPLAVEEGLRFDCPVLGNFRGVVEETDLGGYRLTPGERVFQLYTAANHDPARYEDPDRFIADRDWSGIPAHLAFGYGIHYCIGAHLARAETTVGLKTLYTRLPNLRVSDGFVPEQVPGIVFRTWKDLFMQFDEPARPRLSLSHGI
jgi:cytochrome P450